MWQWTTDCLLTTHIYRDHFICSNENNAALFPQTYHINKNCSPPFSFLCIQHTDIRRINIKFECLSSKHFHKIFDAISIIVKFFTYYSFVIFDFEPFTHTSCHLIQVCKFVYIIIIIFKYSLINQNKSVK